MSKTTTGVLLRHIRQMAVGCETVPDTDHELLGRYLASRDETAFAALVHRHGPMVWNVCRRALSHHHDAEDAFQATFLVLAQKAASVRSTAALAPWLYTVAQRVAGKARSAAAALPTTAAVEPSAPDPFAAMTARDLLVALEAEVAALSERYRGPVVLCWLEGRAQPESAQLLGVSQSTLRRRLEQGKRLLQGRLARRGLTPETVLAVPALAAALMTAVPARALAAAVGGTAASARTASLAAITVPAATCGKLKAAVAILLACVAAAGISVAASRPAAVPPPPSKNGQPSPPAEAAKAPPPDADPLPVGALMRLGSARLRAGGIVYSVAYSPSGQHLASGGRPRSIQLWNPTTGQEVRQIRGPNEGVSAVAWSPDGKRLAGAGRDGILYVWDVPTGKATHRLKGNKEAISTLAFAPTGETIVAGDVAAIRLWQAGSGKQLWTSELKGDGVYSVAFSADGRVVAAAGEDATLRILETATGRLIQSLRGHEGPISSVCFAPDGTLFTTGERGTWLWQPGAARQLGRLGKAEDGGHALALSPDGRLLAVGGADGAIRLWDWAARTAVRSMARRPAHVRSLAFSPDGKTLASAADVGVIRLWDVGTGRPLATLPGHQERLTAVAFAPDGRTVVTTGLDGIVCVWDAQTGKEKRRLGPPEQTPDNKSAVVTPTWVSSVVLSADGILVAAARADATVVVWELATGKEVYRLPGSCAAFSADGKLIACGDRGTKGADFNLGIIRLYDRATGKQQGELRGHLTPVTALCFTPDSKTLLSHGLVFVGLSAGEPGESETQFLRAWDVATGRQRKVLAGEQRGEGLTLSRDGRALICPDRGGKTIAVWETASGGKRVEVQCNAATVAVALAGDGRTLATADMGGTVRLWDLLSAKELGRLAGHGGWVESLAFAPDGTKLVSGSTDGTALIWDVSQLTKRLPPAELTAQELAACWEDLAGDAATAYRALQRLTGSPRQAVAFLAERLQPAPALDGKRLARLLAELDSERFQDRELAGRELEKLGDVAVSAVRKALAGNPSLEMRRRLELVLTKLESADLPPEVLRSLRAVEALEGIGTAPARKLLEALAGAGAAEVRLTQEAQAALRRLQVP